MTHYGPGHRFGGRIATDLGNMDGDWTVDGPSVVKGRSTKTLAGCMPSRTAQPSTAEGPGCYDESTPSAIDFSAVDPSSPNPEAPATISSFPHPELTNIPAPSLSYDFRMGVTMNPRIDIGSGPFGERKWISFQGGSWCASFGSGTVMPGGQDIQIVSPDLQIRVQTNYLLQTHDEPPAYIKATATGWRTAPQHVIEALLDPTRAETVPMTAYKFRLFVELETGDERYKDRINCGMWIGSGTRKGRDVVYDAYRVG